ERSGGWGPGGRDVHCAGRVGGGESGRARRALRAAATKYRLRARDGVRGARGPAAEGLTRAKRADFLIASARIHPAAVPGTCPDYLGPEPNDQKVQTFDSRRIEE